MKINFTDSEKHIKTQKAISGIFYKICFYRSSQTFIFFLFIKMFLLLSNTFLINCSATETERNDTIENLHKNLYNLGNLAYEHNCNEIKKLKTIKIFAFDKNNEKDMFEEGEFDLLTTFLLIHIIKRYMYFVVFL